MAQSALRNLPLERMNARRARAGMEAFVPQAPTKTAGQAMADMLGGMSIPLSVVPVAGDFAGLAADAAMYATRPEERTLGNAAMTLAGIVPGIPGAAAGRAFKGINPQVVQYAQEAGFDPRILQAGSGATTGGPRVADIPRIQELKINVGENRLPEIPAFDIEKYEGYPLMTSMSDRAAAGDVVVDINQVPVGVNRRGGQDYMFDPLNEGKVWASDSRVVLGSGESRMLPMAQSLRSKYGKDPLFMPWTMAPTGVDYSTMTGETMLRYAQNNMNKSSLRSLNRDIKAIIPEWAGIESPESIQRFYNARGDDRKAIIQIMDKKYRDKGSLTAGEARLAVTDQAQLLNPDGTLRNVGQIDTNRPAFTSDVHPTYNTALAGQGIGRMATPLQVFELFPDAARLGGFDPMNPPRNALRSLEMKPWSTVISEDLIRQIQGRRAQPRM